MYRARGLGPSQKRNEKPERVKGLQIASINYPLPDKVLLLRNLVFKFIGIILFISVISL
jgi:hypothetical protein